jgi:hypothetical protein
MLLKPGIIRLKIIPNSFNYFRFVEYMNVIQTDRFKYLSGNCDHAWCQTANNNQDPVL